MKKIALLVILAVAGVLTWWLLETRKKPKDETPEQPPVAVSKYSPAFINAVDTALNNYYNLSEAFVNWDSTAIPQRANALQNNIVKIPFDELKMDTVIHQTAITYLDGFKNDLTAIANHGDITTKRRAFHTFSDNLYNLLRVVKYDGATVYVEECPMAFNDTETAMWLSRTADIRNPYLGLHHPKYKSGMLECGEVKDSLTFIAQSK
jgi:acyl-CoA thioesterase